MSEILTPTELAALKTQAKRTAGLAYNCSSQDEATSYVEAALIQTARAFKRRAEQEAKDAERDRYAQEAAFRDRKP